MKKFAFYIFNFILVGILLSIFATNSFSADKNSSFWIEFIDVGQGDSVLVQCDGEYMIIDGGPSDASSTIYTILRNKNINKIKYMIATHPDSDHIGGLSAVLNYASVEKCYCSVINHETKTFQSLIKYLHKQGIDISLSKVGDEFSIGSASVTILGPIENVEESNNNSIVLLIQYGNNSFLLTGDAEYEEERDILANCPNIKCDVLKVGHHGSASSTSDYFLNSVAPQYAVISVGKDNSYGHPKQEILDKLKSFGVQIYRTDLQGDITIYSDGKTILFETEKEIDISEIEKKEVVTIPAGTTYVLNTSTKRFHLTNCKSVNQMKEKNRAFTSLSVEELLNQKYQPCGNCHPDNEINKAKSTDTIKTNSEDKKQITYVLNTRSGKFHLPSCGSVSDMNQKNRMDVSLKREDIINDNYEPCKRCNP